MGQVYVVVREDSIPDRTKVVAVFDSVEKAEKYCDSRREEEWKKEDVTDIGRFDWEEFDLQ